MLNGSEPSAVFFGLRPEASKYRVRQQRQSDVAVPALPATYLILVEAAFTLGGLKADFDLPSPASDVDQIPTGDLAAGRVDDEIRVLAILVKTAAYQQIMTKATLPGAQLQAPQRA